jgi:hypothetical protein
VICDKAVSSSANENEAGVDVQGVASKNQIVMSAIPVGSGDLDLDDHESNVHCNPLIRPTPSRAGPLPPLNAQSGLIPNYIRETESDTPKGSFLPLEASEIGTEDTGLSSLHSSSRLLEQKVSSSKHQMQRQMEEKLILEKQLANQASMFASLEDEYTDLLVGMSKLELQRTVLIEHVTMVSGSMQVQQLMKKAAVALANAVMDESDPAAVEVSDGNLLYSLHLRRETTNGVN